MIAAWLVGWIAALWMTENVALEKAFLIQSIPFSSSEISVIALSSPLVC